MFEYKVVRTGEEDIEYRDVPLQNCWVEEILVIATRSFDTPVPTQFGFFPKAESLIACQIPNIKLWSAFTYTNSDPLRLAQGGAFPTLDFTSRPPSYWAQALLIYWWDQLAVNLTQANLSNFNSTLQSVLLQVVLQNDTDGDIINKSTIGTVVALSNQSTPISFARQPSQTFSVDQQALLDNLTITAGASQFLISYYWAINYDLGQINEQNIFGNSDLLADATDVFHNNSFILDTFQETPLSDGTIPGDGYRAVKDKTGPLTQTPAVFDETYFCWKWVPKPFLLRLIDVLVPTVVLFTLILLLLYLLFYCVFSTKMFGKRDPRSSIPFLPLSRVDDRTRSNTSYPSFQAVNPETHELVPRLNVEEVETGTDLRYSQDPQYSPHPSYRPIRSMYPNSPPERRPEQPFGEDPFRDEPPQPSSSNTVPQQSAETRTLTSSNPSILETPVNAVAGPITTDHFRDSYRISPDVAALFEAHARRMEQEEFARQTAFDQSSPNWNRRLSERRSSTDLRRGKVVK